MRPSPHFRRKIDWANDWGLMPAACGCVWMGDWKDSLVSVEERWTADRQYVQPSAQIYTNDYLIFPLAPKHYLHIAPGVTETYKPFFLRALQALRMETPANAARWIGSLRHFTTDTGAPPHAAGILGEAHTKMENWVDGSQVRIAGYHPQLLGSTDEEAEAGFKRRTAGLSSSASRERNASGRSSPRMTVRTASRLHSKAPARAPA